jgi:acyl carrier protein
VNRQSLSLPDRAGIAAAEAFAAPRTDVERTLRDIWCEVLGLEHVGIDENFFDLGGHSLAATQVVSRIIQRFGLEISLSSLFEAPTVADLAAVIVRYLKQPVEQE